MNVLKCITYRSLASVTDERFLFETEGEGDAREGGGPAGDVGAQHIPRQPVPGHEHRPVSLVPILHVCRDVQYFICVG